MVLPKDTPKAAQSTEPEQRSVSPMAATDSTQAQKRQSHKRQDAIFIAWLVVCLICSIALFSYSPQDSAWSAVGSGQAMNAAGAIGVSWHQWYRGRDVLRWPVCLVNLVFSFPNLSTCFVAVQVHGLALSSLFKLISAFTRKSQSRSGSGSGSASR